MDMDCSTSVAVVHKAMESIESVKSLPPLKRASACYVNQMKDFLLKPQEAGQYTQQYASLYFMRLCHMRERVKTMAEKCWGRVSGASNSSVPHVERILDIQKEVPCWVLGTTYKHMHLKPSILDEYVREEHILPPPPREKYVDVASDMLILEDESGRMELLWDNVGGISAFDLVTGIIVAIKGRELPSGQFEVVDCCFMYKLPQQNPRIEIVLSAKEETDLDTDRYICLMSGLGVGRDGANSLTLSLCLDFLTGLLGGPKEQQLSSRIVRVVIAGNLLCNTTENSSSQMLKNVYSKRGIIVSSVAPMAEADSLLADLASCVPIDLMPGPHDPSNYTMPQQPLHHYLFSKAAQFTSLNSVTNPHNFRIGSDPSLTQDNDICFLGTSGQPIDDVYKYSQNEDRLSILENTLRWGHLAPTAPDTLASYPFQMRDPFIIDHYPDVYFAGNQPAFASKCVYGIDGKRVRLILVPKFDVTKSIVLLNLRTLACRQLSFLGLGK